ncbi:MAG: adenosylmethionine--8-amino-7-oxononanoate transaminase, partial [Elusimicrobia bacterium]|nr:adenosylmethionine--8-amino-7-oxononanoate transaminase [Elusimicrobiota bacterium]
MTPRSPAFLDRKYLWHPFTQQTEWEKADPIVVRSARGATFTDTKGRTYIDGVSSLWVTAHGHRHPALDRAVRRQLGRMAHTTFLGLTHEPAARLGKALVDIAPSGLERVFYSDNGATSVEVALKMAFQFWAHRGEHRPNYLALAGSYHGDTLGAVSVGGIAAFHKTFRPLLFKSHFAPAPHCYRCPFRKKPSQPELRTGDEPINVRAPRPGDFRAETGCRWECLGGAEKLIKARGARLAAAIVEPIIQGASGMRVMPQGYLKGFERLCRTYGILLIADEVATGFGRTGRMFAVEHEGVRPDFLCVAKALTGGYLPLAATLTTQKIYKTFLGRYEDFKTFFHGHSYTANPLACAAALENLAVFKREKTLERLAGKRQWMTDFLLEIAAHPNVGQVRQA